jgi:hypothetical protein
MSNRSGLKRGFLSGFAATAAMSVSYGVERRLRRSGGGPLDYDDSTVPSHAAMVVLGIHHLDQHRQRQLGFLVHWGYGSAMGWVRTVMGDRMSPAAATGLYWGGLMVMAGTLFPLLGDTPPPWRWKPDVLATSLVQHGVYAVVAGVVSDWLR